jgi:regulation of enolase protein 1 (concanavalin A-like superfamily)
MFRQRTLVAALLTAILAFAVSLPAAAQALPEGFTSRDIGNPGVAGTAKFENGKFTVTGSGVTFGEADNDQFQFVAREVTGDGAITARIVSATGVSPEGAQRIGAMIRENDTPGAAFGTTHFTNRGTGLAFMARDAQDQPAQEVLGFAPRVFPLWVRTQRVNNKLSGYYSHDGQLWVPTSSLDVTMGEKANFGIHVSSQSNTQADTAEFDNVAVAQGEGATAVTGLQACGSDNGVLLQWEPLKGAQSYNVYRSPENLDVSAVKPDQLQKISADNFNQASLTDNATSLRAGGRYVYAVAAVTNGKEGPRVVVVAGKPGPSTPPEGFSYSVIGENAEGDCALGSTGVQMDANGVITMRSGGHDIWTEADGGTFLHRKVSGNFRVTVAMLRTPSATSGWSKAGPMIRESTAAGSRQTLMAVLGAEGAVFSWREETDGSSASTDSVGEGRALTLAQARDALATGPIYLRLIREGDKITPEYSLDGQVYKSAGAAMTLPGLNAELEVGVGHTAHDTTKISEVKFRDLKIEPL